MKKYAIVLAAGKGTRMMSTMPKVLHTVFEKAMIDYVLDRLVEMEMDEIIVVVGNEAQAVKNHIKHDVTYVEQLEQLGTGHAVMQAREHLNGKKGVTMVVCGDTPLFKTHTLNNALHAHRKERASATVLSTMLENPFAYGRIVRNQNDEFVKIVEQKDATIKEQRIQEINSGTYFFDNEILFESLKSLKSNNSQNEYYLTDVLEIIRQKSKTVIAHTLEDSEETIGVNDRATLARATSVMQARINKFHMDAGVTIIDPQTAYICEDSHIGSDTIIYPNTTLFRTKVGKQCIIESGTVIKDSQIDDRNVIIASRITDSILKSDIQVGPNAHFRNGCVIESNCRIGNFVEIKKSSLDVGAKSAHLSYIGDSKIGKRVNMGCGAITVNYDGTNKHETIVEDDAFIGCNVNLVAPVRVHSSALVAAGSTITKDVPAYSMVVARQRETVKENYIKKDEDK